MSTPLDLDTPVDTRARRIAATVPDLLAASGVPGCTIILILDSRIAWSGAFGIADTETGVPLTTDTLFEAYSCTKPLVARCALMLVREDGLALDRPLADSIDPGIDDPRATIVTLRQALTHTAGLNDEPDRPAFLHDPGRRWSYSTTGYALVQRAIETAAARPFGDVMVERVFGPCGMTASRFVTDGPGQLARGHWRNGCPEVDRKILTPDADSLVTTAPDYAAFLLRAFESWQETDGDRVQVDDHLTWGLGWGSQATADGDCLWHFGGGPDAPVNHLVIGFPARRTGIVLFTNGGTGGDLFEPIVRMTIGGTYPIFPWPQFLARHFEANP